MAKTKNLLKYSILVSIILSATKFLGFIREMIVASTLGATRDSDIFKLATFMPQFFYSVVGAALITSFIPVFSGVKNDKKKAQDFFNNVFSMVSIICIILSIIGIIFSPLLVDIYTFGKFNTNDFNRTVTMTRIMMPSIVFFAISGLYMGYQQSYGIFVKPALSNIVSNVVIIAGILIFSQYGITAAVIATLLGAVSQALVQVPFMKDHKHAFLIDFKDDNARSMLKLSVPTIVSTAVSQVNGIVTRGTAAGLIAGSISVIDYAYKISTLINQVFIVSITQIMYPGLSEKFSSGDIKEFDESVINSINIILIIAVPFAFGMSTLSTPIVRILLERGRFDASATVSTAACLSILAFSSIGYSMMDILGKAFFSAKNTFIPMVNGFIAVGLNVVIIFGLVSKFGIIGLALAQVFSTGIMSIIMIIELKKKFRDMKFIKVGIIFIKTLISGAVMSAATYYAFAGLGRLLGNSKLITAFNIVLVVPLAMIVYFIIMVVLRVEELDSIMSIVRKKLKIKTKTS